MLLTEITPWPVLDREPEVSDAELVRLDTSAQVGGVRFALEKLLRVKRVPPVYAVLGSIHRMIGERLDTLRQERNLSHHIAAKTTINSLVLLQVTIHDEMAWLRGQVPVTPDELHNLMIRYLLVRFASVPAPEQQIEGATVIHGILMPQPGRKP